MQELLFGKIGQVPVTASDTIATNVNLAGFAIGNRLTLFVQQIDVCAA